MILIAAFPENITPEDVQKALSGIVSKFKIDAIVRPMEIPVNLVNAQLPQKTYVLTAQGRNKSGLVYGISSFCSKRGINIIDLLTTLKDGRYTMILQLDLSSIENIRKLRQELQEYGEEAGLQVVMQHYDIFKVTNEVNLV